MSKNTPKDSFSNPFANVSAMFEQFKVPGVDTSSLLAERRKDIEALVAVNQSAYETMQALGKKQVEMLQENIAGLQQAASQTAAGMAKGKGMADTQAQTALAQAAFEKTIADMKELAEIARESQANTLAIMTQRAGEQMQELRKMMGGK